MAVIELKNAADENADVEGAFNQLQTYKKDIPGLFTYNAALMASDGLTALVGTLTAERPRFMPWRNPPQPADNVIPFRPRSQAIAADPSGTYATNAASEMEILIKGVFYPHRFLELIRYFTVFESDGETTIKKMAGYHQYYAVNKAVKATIEATSDEGDQRAGVIWHTQGSGKSLSMTFYAGKIVQHPDMANPTLVVLTDRNDLDEQLFTTFSKCSALLRQTPTRAADRADLKDKLQVASGGIIFTTIQKFAPEERGGDYEQLSPRRNIIFIADEAHRSQYGLKARVVTTKNIYTGKDEAYTAYGFAKYLRDALPNASFIGFTGTPIEATDKNTQRIFGDYIDVYDIQRAVEDGATVKIYYEPRFAKINLDDKERPQIDPNFEEVTEAEEPNTREKLKSKWAQLESIVGSPKRLALVAKDITTHFENRLAAMEGKGMIVCMSRRICAELYDEIVQLRPDWHSEDNKTGSIKVIMTGSAADPEGWQQHIRSKKRRDDLAKRLRDPQDPLKLVIVRDMWLTGFDAPCLHTMYVDKAMKGHNLMQAIARVNRVFGSKQGGLVVDYIGITEDLKTALKDYTERDQSQAGIPIERALALMQEKYEIVANLLHGFDYNRFHTAPPAECLTILKQAMDWLLRPEAVEENVPQRYIQFVTELSKAFALCAAEENAIAIRDNVGFFQAVKAGLTKYTVQGSKSRADLDTAVRQIVSRSVASEQVIDIFDAAGINKPEISILSEDFLSEVLNLPQKNLALEALRKLLSDEIKVRSRKNVVQSRKFSEMLENSILRYQNRAITSAQVIQELVDMGRNLRSVDRRGQALGLSDEELSFYDALEVDDASVEVLGNDKLKAIAQDLVRSIRNNASIDWTKRETVQAKIRVIVKRLLKKHKYPADKREKTIQVIFQQAETRYKDRAA